ncbi:MAG: pirin family protein [Actinomycetota bacterium]|nr:pirin family protein [Actinomycetota bacterium]
MREVIRRVRGTPTTDGGGVKLLRVMGTQQLPMLDPFLMLDEFRSDVPGDYIAGFPEHPHRGFETVTWMLAGRMRHGDNQGHSGVLGPGSVQWMTAGRGIVHSEMPEQENGLLWGFQLWVNLPARDKMTAPKYQEFAATEIPEVVRDGDVRVKVIAGSFDGVAGPVQQPATQPLYLDVRLPAGASTSLDVPRGHSVFVYVYEGNALLGSGAQRETGRGVLAVLGDGDAVDIAAADGAARMIVVAGLPLREPVARYGPFVMNTHDEIEEAIRDYNAGRL